MWQLNFRSEPKVCMTVTIPGRKFSVSAQSRMAWLADLKRIFNSGRLAAKQQPQFLRNREDHMFVRYVEEEFFGFSYPFVIFDFPAAIAEPRFAGMSYFFPIAASWTGVG